MPRDEEILDNQDNHDEILGGAAASPNPITVQEEPAKEQPKTKPIDFNEIRRAVAIHKMQRTAYRSAINSTVTVDPKVEIWLNDRIYFLEYTFRAALDFQQETGINLARGELEESKLKDDLKLLAKVIYHGMTKHHKQDRPSEEELLDLFDFRRIPYYLICISDALEIILPDMALVQRLEMEMKEDPEFLPFLQTSGGPGSGHSEPEF